MHRQHSHFIPNGLENFNAHLFNICYLFKTILYLLLIFHSHFVYLNDYFRYHILRKSLLSIKKDIYVVEYSKNNTAVSTSVDNQSSFLLLRLVNM